MQVVPVFSQLLQWFSNLLWNSLSPTTVQPDFQSELSYWRKWHKRARYVESLKTIASFEIAQAVIKPICINKVGNPFSAQRSTAFAKSALVGASSRWAIFEIIWPQQPYHLD